MFGQTAPMIRSLTFATITDNQLVAIGVFLITLIFIIPLAGIIATTWANVIKLRLKAGLKQQMITLKQQMIERGMTADEIVRVVGLPSEALDDLSEENDDKAGVVNDPCASEVVFATDGEWHSGLVLGRSGDRYHIHICPGYEGAETSDNEWVKADRVRFPSLSSGQEVSLRGLADHAGAFDAGECCAQPKKEPMPAEV
jgi:hypothetical protein